MQVQAFIIFLQYSVNETKTVKARFRKLEKQQRVQNKNLKWRITIEDNYSHKHDTLQYKISGN